ncbi:FecR family protein [Polynucleobacter arcticus]|nr:FecR family protein [Polynucleobacter arcticus]
MFFLPRAFRATTLFLVLINMGWTSFAFADAMPPVSGVISMATEPVAIKTTSVAGKVTNRAVGIGQPIYLNDEIKTGPNNKLQILLKDQTVFNMGPNSVMTIDKFVFDATKGELSVGIQKGAFKFVSGKVSNSNPDAMKVTLPNATISVRGTGVAGNVDPDGASTVVLLHGVVDIASAAGSSTLSKSGWGVQVAPGGIVGQPSVTPSDVLKNIMGSVAQIKAPVAEVIADTSSTSPQASAGAASTVNSSTSTTSSSGSSPVGLTANNEAARDAAKKIASNFLQSVPASGAISTTGVGAVADLANNFTSRLSAVSATSANTSSTLASYLNYLKLEGVDTDSLDLNTVSSNAELAQKLVTLRQKYVASLELIPADQLAAISSTLESLRTQLLTSGQLNFTNYNAFRNAYTGPAGTLTFGFDTAKAMSCINLGNSCGSGASATVNSHAVTLNFLTNQITNTYNVSYSIGGPGSSMNLTSGSYVATKTENMSSLSPYVASKIFYLPTDANHSMLKMLATFTAPTATVTNTGTAYKSTGIFNTAIQSQTGANGPITMSSGVYSATQVVK